LLRCGKSSISILFILLVLFLTFFTSIAYSQIQNGSFESGTNPGSYLNVTAPDNTTITGWQVVNADIDYIGSYWQAADGSRSIDLSGNVGSAGVIQQTFTTSPGATYYITFSLAGNPDGSQGIKTVQVSANPCSGCSPENYSFDTTGHSTTNMGWVDSTYAFTANSTSTILAFTSLTDSGYGPAIDNIRESHTLPHPVSSGVNTKFLLIAAILGISIGSFLINRVVRC
jgi:choice-of-anchor C domain-containing protein